MRGARCIRAQTDGGQLGGGAPRVVWLTLGADPKAISAWSAAQRLNQEDRPCHLVWDPLRGEIAQMLPIVRAGCALGTRESIDYAPGPLPHRPPSVNRVNREGRLCVQIGVLSTPREPFTSYHMIGLSEIMAWLDSWQIPRRWPAGTPAPSGSRPGRAAGHCGRAAATSAPLRCPAATASAPAASTSTRSPARPQWPASSRNRRCPAPAWPTGRWLGRGGSARCLPTGPRSAWARIGHRSARPIRHTAPPSRHTAPLSHRSARPGCDRYSEV